MSWHAASLLNGTADVLSNKPNEFMFYFDPLWLVFAVPGLLLGIVAVLLGLAVYRSSRGAWRRPRARYRRGGSRPGPGPRDW